MVSLVKWSNLGLLIQLLVRVFSLEALNNQITLFNLCLWNESMYQQKQHYYQQLQTSLTIQMEWWCSILVEAHPPIDTLRIEMVIYRWEDLMYIRKKSVILSTLSVKATPDGRERNLSFMDLQTPNCLNQLTFFLIYGLWISDCYLYKPLFGGREKHFSVKHQR